MRIEDLNYLRYHMLKGVSLRQKKYLIQYFGSLEVLLAQDHEVLLRFFTQEQIYFLRGNSQKDLHLHHNIECIQRDDVSIIHFESALYPECLRVLPDPPMVLFARGQLACLEKIGLAVIGARQCQIHSYELAYHFSCELAKQDICIISGMAKGIDGQAHCGALASGHSCSSIAVMGTGFDYLYPRGHEALFHDLVKKGLVITEQVYGSVFHRAHFPMRNRLIAGLSAGVLVVEAKRKSGSLITAEYALNLNREIMAMPGSCFLQAHQGCHDLIKQGAVLVDSVQDVLSTITKVARISSFKREKNWLERNQSLSLEVSDKQFSLSSVQEEFKPLVQCILSGAMSLDELSRQLGQTTDEVYMKLFELEQRALVRQDELGRYIWCPTMLK